MKNIIILRNEYIKSNSGYGRNETIEEFYERVNNELNHLQDDNCKILEIIPTTATANEEIEYIITIVYDTNE